jgi:hypothetical protein
MQPRSPSDSFPSDPSPGKLPLTARQLVLRQARKLHRAATSTSIVFAMPAVRRVHAAGVFPGLALSALYRERATLQRKHFLRALAVEAGFPDWETFRPQLDLMPPEAFEHFKLADEGFAKLNTWFSNEAQAQAFADQHGGRVVKVGAQAVVMPLDVQAEAPDGGQP